MLSPEPCDVRRFLPWTVSFERLMTSCDSPPVKHDVDVSKGCNDAARLVAARAFGVHFLRI
jgi:hypothetical protein